MGIKAYAAKGPKQPLEPFEYEPGPLGPHEVEVKVSHCGICHSDLAMIDNDWGFSAYPLVPGHEVVGHGRGDRVGRRRLEGRAAGRRGLAVRLVRALRVVRPAAWSRSAPGAGDDRPSPRRLGRVGPGRLEVRRCRSPTRSSRPSPGR